MATLAVVVAGYLLATHVGALPDGALNVVRESATRPLNWVLLAAVVLLGALVPVLRMVVTRRTLRSRVVLELLPSEEFDPPADAVVRLAAGLARTRRSLRGWLDAPASAVRVRLDVDAEGRMRYRLEIPAHARHAVRAALGAYGEPVEVRPLNPAEAEALTRDGDAGRCVRAELVLARSSREPLAAIGIDPDPLAGSRKHSPRSTFRRGSARRWSSICCR